MKKTTKLALASGLPMIIAAGSIAQESKPHSGMFRFPDVSKSEIVFVYANDLWIVDKKGGTARPLASPAGQETYPKFNAEGESVAFIGNYDGDRDLYTVEIDGGIPHRVTHHPGNERLNDWTNTGDLLFSYNALAGNPAHQNLFTVSPEGGLPSKLPIPYGAVGSINDSGEWVAYTTDSRDARTWKRYRGGLATDIWLYNLKTNEAKKVTDWEGTDTTPMWHGDKVYYISDNGEQERLNVWCYDTKKGTNEQITEFEDNDVKFASMGPGSSGKGEIVFQLGSQIHLLDLRNKKTKAIEIDIPGSRESVRPKRLNAFNQMAGGDISSTGKRAVVEARGDIFTVPEENGPVRQMTNTSGAAERSPSWSPDGRWIAYFSDEDGEYELYITQSDGKGETRQLTDGNKTYWMNSMWSPDSETILMTDKAGNAFLVDVESGEMTHMDKDPWANQPNFSWSHDSKWIAYDRSSEDSPLQSIWIYNTETGEKHQVTSGFFADSNPAFSRKGDYLYYSSNRNFTSPQYEDVGSTFVYAETGRIIAVPLNDEVENNQLRESDEETWEEDEVEETEAEDSSDESEDSDDAESDEASDEESPAYLEGYNPDHPLWGKWEGSVTGMAALGMPMDEVNFSLLFIIDEEGNITGQSESMGETDDLGDMVKFDEETMEFYSESTESGLKMIQKATLSGDTMTGTLEIPAMGFSANWTAERVSTEITEEEIKEFGDSDSEASDSVEINFDDFERRGFELQIGAGNFSQLASNDKGNLMYLRTSGDAPSLKIYDITADEPSEKTVLPICVGYSVSGDGKKIIAATPAGFGFASASAGQSVKPISASLMKTVDLKEEWRQIVVDAWRRHRDFFYVANMHGVDWEGVLDHYLPMVDDAVSREDISFIIGEMIGELNVGHAYYYGGDVESQPYTNVGLLGVDYSVANTSIEGEEYTGFRIDTIYEGAAWDTDARNPLNAHGLDVNEGDIITHVNGMAVDTSKDPWAAFIGTAGMETNLTLVSADTDEDGNEIANERTVTVLPMGSETNLRYRDWIEDNRRYVEEASDGKIGYIYVPNTGVNGQNDLFRQFYGQAGKEALLIDERWNGGGQIPNRFIELLNRPRTNYWYRRDGKDWPWPYDSHQGPKAMLINGNAGSGGDMFPWLFKHHDLGLLIGTRTWGGLVGISGVPGLIDGGYTAVPNFGFYELDGTWGIEGHGVDPDIEVVADPSKMVDGSDPQLDVAIEHLLQEIKTNGYKPPQPPRPPVRTGIGIAEEDK
ncbi:MAG: PDZ domain-containing protein [Phycisphaerales bacterium]|nr:PDZ domain-containing protein [Phycisphaerales bacterium]